MSQIEFLILICVGALISSSTIIALSFQAGTGEDTHPASAGCTAAPFLYAIGWALQYSSLSAKTYRLFLVMRNSQNLIRAKVTFLKMLQIVFVVIAIDLTLLISWTIVSPLIYERSEESVNINEDSGVVTIETAGSCVMKDGSISIWAFVVPIMGLHIFLLIGTNCLLYQVRNVADRYQEQKYIAMASILMFEILIVGMPVMVAVNDSPVATHIILVGIIAVSDIGILCFTFIPKIVFQRAGLEEGVTFGESVMRNTHLKASMRESVLRQNEISLYKIPSDDGEEFARRMAPDSTNFSIDESRDSPQILSLPGPSLLEEIIIEEETADVQEEQTTCEPEARNKENQGQNLVKARTRQRAAEKFVMEQLERKMSESSLLAKNTVLEDQENDQQTVSSTNVRERMMQTTTIEEPGGAMATTNSILSEQEKYRKRLIDAKEKEDGDGSESEGEGMKKDLHSASPPPLLPGIIGTSQGDNRDGKRDSVYASRHLTEMTEESSNEDTIDERKAAMPMYESSAASCSTHSLGSSSS
ncbi:7 transmembrane sweet-taste receptor of 3 GCPR-domain containing protein [Nitzschia inconspicua]|uniref:7 transmembrane sweet-taste receptor of 3 GCPR-domain containing protein n=1 Tax=Nitzschia inconspicua TaxID=303405 RepID=A0A9K3PTG6_9STRA|nr:7 transmembrane sweet-taste receptor of 3 GCPR-domain containing protein [Nitzschia inconspicua]